MPYEYSRNDASKCVTVTTSGVLTLAEMLSIVERQAVEGAGDVADVLAAGRRHRRDRQRVS